MEAGVAELRNHLSKYLRLVREGHEVTVTEHGRAIARLAPLAGSRTLDRLIAEGVVSPAEDLNGQLDSDRVSAQGTVSDLVAEQRR